MKTFLAILILLITSNAFGQPVIISHNGKNEKVNIPGFNIEIYSDSIISYSWLGFEAGVHSFSDFNKLIKNVYKIIEGKLIRVKIYNSVYVPPIQQDGYFLFTDSLRISESQVPKNTSFGYRASNPFDLYTGFPPTIPPKYNTTSSSKLFINSLDRTMIKTDSAIADSAKGRTLGDFSHTFYDRISYGWKPMKPDTKKKGK